VQKRDLNFLVLFGLIKGILVLYISKFWRAMSSSFAENRNLT